MNTSVVTDGDALSIRKFEGKNFVVWKAQVMAYLTLKECETALTISRPITTMNDKDKERELLAQEERDERNNKAKALLLLSLDDDRAMMVIGLKYAKEIWKRLIDSYESSSLASRILIRRSFYDAQMREGESVTAYVGRVPVFSINL